MADQIRRLQNYITHSRHGRASVMTVAIALVSLELETLGEVFLHLGWVRLVYEILIAVLGIAYFVYTFAVRKNDAITPRK